MSIRNCRHLCHRDGETGEVYCPAVGKWLENCPKAEYAKEESENGGDHDDD